ncbi:NADH-quinone oxidoreductase subunit A [Candidatus Trichorickettsia mobilis]|uniref:NADH-quinone oxidoreductase subunit A n=1 Tax=Candidatus Trichorickettsia mobilis TaxID=1346319 RepID=A0ABZ0USA7_9RICK|nr:NADH-quinone oxidoreductase subunit A [Candidatus Trichorickettsia mobilis]
MTTHHILQSSDFLQQYLPVAIFFGVAIFLSLVVIMLPVILAQQKPNKGKLKEYECGFDAFGDARGQFDIRFYLIAILFIIFDLEVTFLVPWAISLGTIGKCGFFSMMFFLLVLTIGFIYEWKQGALDW